MVECGRTTCSPTRNILFHTVPAFCAPLIGRNSDSRAATLPNGASAAYRAVGRLLRLPGIDQRDATLLEILHIAGRHRGAPWARAVPAIIASGMLTGSPAVSRRTRIVA
jgi:hypothetical protein